MSPPAAGKIFPIQAWSPAWSGATQLKAHPDQRRKLTYSIQTSKKQEDFWGEPQADGNKLETETILFKNFYIFI